MLTETTPREVVPPSSDEWVPDWWGTEEENAKESAAFATWTRGMRTDQ